MEVSVMFKKNDLSDKNKIQEDVSGEEIMKIDEEILWMRRIISHNVRMPMSIIKGYGDLLKHDLLGEREKLNAINSIYENILYLDQILSVVFDYGEEKEITLTKVNICEVLRKVVGYVKDIARKNEIKITLNTETEDIFIEAEFIPIIRIFYLIIENSFKYLEKGNSVDFSVYILKDEVLIVYKDNGLGINESDITHIFDKGFRGQNVKNKEGSGYGLYEVSETIEKYKGNIEIKSHLGHGFSIFIKFPKYQ